MSIMLREYKDLEPLLPPFCREVIGKDQTQVCPEYPSNCINGAFNFFDHNPRFEPYTPLDLLNRLQKEFTQLLDADDFCFGDLVVIWYRSQEALKVQPLDVCLLDAKDPEFPHDLVFDHVMVRVTPEVVFHKANPKLDSPYELLNFEDALLPSIGKSGLEITYHRKI